MKLYYSPGACSLADHIALAAVGLAYDLIKVDLRAKTTEDGRDFTAINPKGYVPTLELDDGAILTENIAILLYIADQGGALLPGGMGRWRAIETTAFISTEIHKNFGPFFNPNASEAERDEGRAKLAKRYATVAEMLDGHDYLIGDALSIADCYLFVTLRWAAKFQLDLPESLTAFVARMNALPPVQKALTEEGLA